MKLRGYWYVRIWEDLINWILGETPDPQKKPLSGRNSGVSGESGGDSAEPDVPGRRDGNSPKTHGRNDPN